MQYFIYFLKGVVIGLANVIPGVSGGTMALLLGIYEKLLSEIKSFDIKVLKLLLKFDFKRLSKYLDLHFIGFIFLGLAVSILSIAKLLEWFYVNHRVLTLAFFFGLVAASIISVWRNISQWTWQEIVCAFLGILIGIWIISLNPNVPNSNIFYVFVCGVIAIISMILPGLSGSFILLIMGNYFLVFKALNHFDISVLIPFILGCVIGLIVFSYFFSWILKNYKNQTLALLTGFIIASLIILWPWSKPIYKSQNIEGKIKEVISSYSYYLPDWNQAFIFACSLSLFAFLLILIVEKIAKKNF